MSESVKSRIFDYLFTTKSVAKGTEVALAICLQGAAREAKLSRQRIARQIIIEKYGGIIQVDSQLRQSTTFTLQVPEVENKRIESQQRSRSHRIPDSSQYNRRES
jgi:signal transduction histidine kinase